MKERKKSFWVLIIIAILLNVMMLLGQTGSLINYDFTVDIGLQESAEEVSDVGIAFLKGFGWGDTLFYIPLFIIGIIGLLKRKRWGVFTMFGALAVTVYWPIVCLAAVFGGRDDFSLGNDTYISYAILLPLISIYGLWGMWYVYKNYKQLINN